MACVKAKGRQESYVSRPTTIIPHASRETSKRGKGEQEKEEEVEGWVTWAA